MSCGIIVSMLCIGTDIFAAINLDGYSYLDQAVSELTAIGAPTRPMVVTLLAICNLLLIAFGTGVLMSASDKRSLLNVGILLIIFAIIGLVSFNFPMNQRGLERTFSDTMHLVFGGIAVLLILFFIGFGANTFGKGFRSFSIGTIIALLLFGFLAGLQGSNVAQGLPTPWMGIIERVSYYSPFAWIFVLATLLLKKTNQKI